MKRWSFALFTLLLVLSMILAACGSEEEEPTTPPETVEETAEETTEEAAGEGTYLDRAYAGEFEGTAVTMTGPFADADAVKFDNSVAEFEEATGIDIQYEGSKEFEASITIRVEAGDPPAISSPRPPSTWYIHSLCAPPIGAALETTTYFPSGSQTGDRYEASHPVVSGRGSPPSGRIQTLSSPLRSETKTIWLPSGLKRGCMSWARPCVSRVAVPPLMGIV